MRPRPGMSVVSTLLFSILGMSGCDPLHRQEVRQAPPLIPEEIDPAADVSNMAPESKGFFKKDRSAGTWSPEAREIESHFGASDF